MKYIFIQKPQHPNRLRLRRPKLFISPTIPTILVTISNLDTVSRIPLGPRLSMFLKGGERSHDKRNNTYGLHNTQRTFGRDTLEVLPQEHYYRNADTIRTKLFRPTLQHLHDREESKPTNERINELEQHRKQVQESRKEEENAPELTANKFGWIQGVFVRCLLNIWGVILFLRMSWIVGTVLTHLRFIYDS